MSKSSDDELVSAVLSGRKDAYAELYDRYSALVRAICHDATRNLAEAQDLAQDVFLRAYEKLEQLRNPERFGKWIIAIARLRGREWQRQKHRNESRYAQVGAAQSDSTESADDSRIEQLRKKITLLPEKERLALHAFYLQGRSADNACSVMGLSRSGFYRVLERARKRLQRQLAREMENIR